MSGGFEANSALVDVSVQLTPHWVHSMRTTRLLGGFPSSGNGHVAFCLQSWNFRVCFFDGENDLRLQLSASFPSHTPTVAFAANFSAAVTIDTHPLSPFLSVGAFSGRENELGLSASSGLSHLLIFGAVTVELGFLSL
ncbi:hypothetical protein SDJN02_21688, partial [Cucurbita argyrosperma subsp. argyrosperma]